MSLRKIIQYGKDVKYAVSNFEIGLQRRDVVEGYFVDNVLGKNQKLMYYGMLDAGFKRTPWQIVFPGQTAGLIRKIQPPVEEMDEIHVRFYDDGIISAELEHRRFSLGHWRMKREDGNDHLVHILNTEIHNVPDDKKEEIQRQITLRDYTAINPNEFQMPNLARFAASAFIAIQYPLTTAGAIYLVSQGDFFYALEPAFLSAIETSFIAGVLMPKSNPAVGAL